MIEMKRFVIILNFAIISELFQLRKGAYVRYM